MLTKKDVVYVSKLARIGLSDKEIEYFTQQLEAILEYIAKLNKLDVSQVEPTSHVLPLKNVYMDDVLKKPLPVDEVMKLTTEKDRNQFRVPKVIE